MEQVELVMPGKTRPARHERVVAIANRVGGDIAEVRTRSGSRLLRHPDRFISREEDKLRTVDVVRFDENTVPGRVARPLDKLRVRRVVAELRPGLGVAGGGWVIDEVAKALPEPGVVRSVLGDHLDVYMLAEVELTDEAYATVTLVPGS